MTTIVSSYYFPSRYPFDRSFFFFLNDPAPPDISPLPLPAPLPTGAAAREPQPRAGRGPLAAPALEHLEDRFLPPLGQARAFIVDRDADAIADRGRADGDRRTGRRDRKSTV